MVSEKKGSRLGEILLFSAAAVVFYKVSLFLPIFVIPLTVLYRRRGFIPGLLGSAIAFGGIAGIKLYGVMSVEGAVPRYDLFGIDLIVPLTFFLGLALLEYPYLARFRLYQKMIAAAVLAAAASLPLLRFVMTSPEFDAILRAQIEAMIRSFSETSADVPFSGTEQVVRLSRLVFLNTYAAGYFLTLAFNWVIGARLARRLSGEEGEFPAFSRFKLPDAYVWPFLLCWAAVFVSLFKDLGTARMIAWNCALILTVLYGCQGVGIIRTLTAEVARGTKMMMTFLMVTLVFIPGINVLVLAGVPLLGVSELWIRYRNKERS